MTEIRAQEVRRIEQANIEFRELTLQRFEQIEQAMDELRKMVGDRGVQIAQMASKLSRLTQATLGQGEPVRSATQAEAMSVRSGRMGKIEFPRFNGEDFVNWLYQCEMFFEFEGIIDEYKLQLVVIHLDGKALLWHRGFMKERTEEDGLMTWEGYKKAMNARFTEQAYEDPMADVPNLVQYGSVKEYTNQFDDLGEDVLDHIEVGQEQEASDCDYQNEDVSDQIKIFDRHYASDVEKEDIPQQVEANFHSSKKLFSSVDKFKTESKDFIGISSTIYEYKAVSSHTIQGTIVHLVEANNEELHVSLACQKIFNGYRMLQPRALKSEEAPKLWSGKFNASAKCEPIELAWNAFEKLNDEDNRRNSPRVCLMLRPGSTLVQIQILWLFWIEGRLKREDWFHFLNLERSDDVAYKLPLFSIVQIHCASHVAILKKATDPSTATVAHDLFSANRHVVTRSLVYRPTFPHIEDLIFELSKAENKIIMPKERRDRDGVEKLKHGLKWKNEMVFDPSRGIFDVFLPTIKEDVDSYSTSTSKRNEDFHRNLFVKCKGLTGKCMRNDKLDKSSACNVVLLDGSTSIPKMQQLCQDFIGTKELRKNSNSDETLVYGLAVRAAILSNKGSGEVVQELLLFNPTPLSMPLSNFDHEEGRRAAPKTMELASLLRLTTERSLNIYIVAKNSYIAQMLYFFVSPFTNEFVEGVKTILKCVVRPKRTGADLTGTWYVDTNGGGEADTFNCEIDIDICVGTLNQVFVARHEAWRRRKKRENVSLLKGTPMCRITISMILGNYKKAMMQFLVWWSHSRPNRSRGNHSNCKGSLSITRPCQLHSTKGTMMPKHSQQGNVLMSSDSEEGRRGVEKKKRNMGKKTAGG